MGYQQGISTMNFFTENRIKRNTALVVLLVWFFALASGVANACLLEQPGPQSSKQNASTVLTSMVSAESVVVLGASAGHDDHSDVSKESCLKVCDEGTQTLPTVHLSDDNTDPSSAPWVTTLWTESQQLVSASRRAFDAARPFVDLPLRVRYSRLAL